MTRTEKVQLFVLDLVIALTITLLWTDLPSIRHLKWSAGILFALQIVRATGNAPSIIRDFAVWLAFFLPAILIPWLWSHLVLLALASVSSAALTAWLFQEEYQERAIFLYLGVCDALIWLIETAFFASKNSKRVDTTVSKHRLWIW